MPNLNNYQVKYSAFQDCCGIYIMYGFYTVPPLTFEAYRTSYGSNQTEAQWKKYVSTSCESKEEYTSRMKQQIQVHIDGLKNKKSYFIAVTNKHEKGYGIEEILLDLGFEVIVPETRNPTGTTIVMWIYHLLPKVKQETKSLFKKANDAIS